MSTYLPSSMCVAPVLPTISSDAVPKQVSPHTALLINPFYRKDAHASFGKHVLTPTLALTSVAAATPEPWSVRLWDENLLQGPPPQDPLPQVVGITVHLTFAQRAYELARWYRSQGSVVVLGGLHMSACAEEGAAHADAVAIGDGVVLWPRILKDVERGVLRARYETDFRTPYREQPIPRRDLLPRESFLTTASLIATRGCSNRCGFCYLATKGMVMPAQFRDVEQVAAEFVATGEPYAVFTDNNLGADRGYLLKLCEALRPLNRIWSAAVTIDVTDDPVLVRAMALAGCTGVFVGLETLQDENLRDARKRSPLASDYARRVRLFHEHGIQVNASFVLGFDHDGPDVFTNTVAWIEEHRLACATFHILTPYPGTPLFRQFAAEGRLLHRDWERYDTSHVVFRPKRMTVEQLEQGYAWCYERLFSHASIWRRRPESWSGVAAYLAMSYLYKRSNRVWPWLIRQRWVRAAWRPLIEASRWRHQRFRARLARETLAVGMVMPPGV